MPHTIFFSWQSDTPSNCGRSFIEAALKRAIELLAAEATVESVERDDALALDSDTRDVAGTPPIVDTIFKKIDACAVFVSDLTLIGKRIEKDELMPNPNVLVEHGWALKSLTHARLIAVMNTAFGERRAENLPFDLRHMRWPIPYSVSPKAGKEAIEKERERLALVLKDAIGAILRSSEFKAALSATLPAPRSFVAAVPKFGQSRFRESHGELGVIDGGFIPLPHAGKGTKLAAGPAVWLRAMPAFDPAKTWPVSQLKQATTKPGMTLLPIGQLGDSWNHVRAEDGFGFVGLESADPTITHSVAFVFVTGEIWTIQILPDDGTDLSNMEGWFAQAFSQYVHFLRTGLDVKTPIRWIAGIEQTKGRYLRLIAPPGHYYLQPRIGPCTSENIVKEGIYSDGDELHVALRPFFELIYDRCGAERPAYMDTPLLAAASRP